jgi:hypothetical protein
MILTTLRTFVETDLADGPLQVMLDAADEDLTLYVGPDTADIDKQDMEGQEFLFLGRPVTTITSITEYSGGVTTTLAASDYELQPNKMDIRRLSTGTNPASGWYGTVTVSFAPADLNRRNRAIMALVQLDLDHRHGVTDESIGDHRRSQQDYDAARAKIISGARTRSFA